MSEPDIAFVANLLADSSRAAMCIALAGGEATPTGEFAARAGISARAAGNDLAKLIAGRVLRVERQGRWRYYRLANADVGHSVDLLAVVAPPRSRAFMRDRSDGAARRLKDSRTRYSHVAMRRASHLPTGSSPAIGSRTTGATTGSRRLAAVRCGRSGSMRPSGEDDPRPGDVSTGPSANPHCRSDRHRPGGSGPRTRLDWAPAGNAGGGGDPLRPDVTATPFQRSMGGDSAMITLSIRYTIDPRKRPDFERYARTLVAIIPRCGGGLVGYWLPTLFAGPTNVATALIDFPSLAAYEQYRERLVKDPDNVESVRRATESGCILVEDRSFLERV